MIEVSASFVHNRLFIVEYYIFLGAAASSDKNACFLCTQVLQSGSDRYLWEKVQGTGISPFLSCTDCSMVERLQSADETGGRMTNTACNPQHKEKQNIQAPGVRKCLTFL